MAEVASGLEVELGEGGARPGGRRARPQGKRLPGVDALRGLAVVLMVADHLALSMGLGGFWRLTFTRAALPIFAVLAGSLARTSRPIGRRWAWVGITAPLVAVLPVPGVFPDVLLLLGLGAIVVACVPRPAWPVVLVVCMLQPSTWPIPAPWTGYQPGLVVGLVLVGALCGRTWLDRLPPGPAWLRWLGKHPLTLYIGHLVVLSAAVTL